jgi:hypothetical protein
MHKEELLRKNSSRLEAWQEKHHMLTFGDGLQQKLMGVDTSCCELDSLAIGLSITVLQYQGYDINAYTFYKKKQDEKSINQNSSVHIDAYDDNRRLETYYGFIG